VRASFAGFVLLAAGCFTPNLGEGQVACGESGACPSGYHCAGDGKCYSVEVDLGLADLSSGDLAGGCARATCGADTCGVIPDNCGSTIDCGDPCTTGTTCGGGGTAHVCGCPTEVMCGARNCGTMPNGCGGVTTCGGACPTGQSCGGGMGANKMANVCNAGMACMPMMCSGNMCGLISDGCAAVLDCGTCQTGKSCGSDHMCH
jgi:hypothetical protein